MQDFMQVLKKAMDIKAMAYFNVKNKLSGNLYQLETKSRGYAF